MAIIMGLDPSLQKSGYVIIDTDEPDNKVVEKGLLKTDTTDGILVQRLIKQSNQIKDKIRAYNIKFIGAEAPFFDYFSTELLFALNQFLHKVYLDLEVFVVYFPPQELKKLVFPNDPVTSIHKPQMISKAKDILELHGKKLAEDVADAYWAGHFGKKFYKWFIEKTISEDSLGDYERNVFCGKHKFTRGPKKGTEELHGIIYRENEMFYDFYKIKRRKENANQQEK